MLDWLLMLAYTVCQYALVVVLLIASTLFIIRQFAYPSPKPNFDTLPSLKNKVVVITGSNSGIGLYTAKLLAKKGAYLILACRSQEKARKAREEIIQETGNDQVQLMPLDVSDLDSVRKFANNYKRSGLVCDVLINNAGILLLTDDMRKQSRLPETTKDGLELHFCTNFLGHFLLTHLMMEPLLKSESGGRVINVSSLMHFYAFVNTIEDVNTPSAFHVTNYCRSKWCQVSTTFEFQRRLQKNKQLKDKQLTLTVLNPGTISTGIVSNFGLNQLWQSLAVYLGSTLDHKGFGPAYLAMAPREEVDGVYFDLWETQAPHASTKDEKLARELWERSEKWCGLKPEEKLENLKLP